MNLLQIVSNLAFTLALAWAFSGNVILSARWLQKDPPALALAVYHELKPMYLPTLAVAFVTDVAVNPSFDFWRPVGVAVYLLCWRAGKDIDDDDRWKRRRERMSERVTEVAGRLKVIPQAETA